MTDLFLGERDRIVGTDLILAEVKQFKVLSKLGLPNDEIAHRMACSRKEVEQVRYLLGAGRTKVNELNLKYTTRLLLGGVGIKTINDLLNWSDQQLLSIRGLGPKTLLQIKESLCTFMENHHG